MIKSGLQKISGASLLCGFLAAMILCAPAALFAEGVFLKNGQIVEGKIASETDAKVVVTLPDKSKKDILRKDILRVSYQDSYKEKQYMTKTDNTVIEMFLVDEDRSTYTYRVDLNSAKEVIIQKTEVVGISNKEVSVKRELTPEELLRLNASFLRVGINYDIPQSGYSKDKYAVQGLFADLALYRARSASGNGLDFFVRGQYNESKVTHPEKLGYEPPITGYVPASDSTIKQTSIGAGARFIYGDMYFGCLWQGYVMAYYQYSSVDVSLSYKNPVNGSAGGLTYNYKSQGVVGGAGLEVGVFRYAGFFAEYTYGFSPAFANKKSVENGAIRAGVTLRTPSL